MFNFYGLIIGIAIVTALQLIEKKLRRINISEQIFYKISVFASIFAVIGARVWHVGTDYHLYVNDFVSAFQIWNGGLSIFGGVLGGIFGVVLAVNILPGLNKLSFLEKKQTVYKLLDVSVFALPVAQAIGRVANYVNQELYGAPTMSIFKIYIDEKHRLPGYETVKYYHPLFFYEMVFTGLFAICLYIFDTKPKFFKKLVKNRKVLNKVKIPKLGEGKLFKFYIFYYSLIRFLLDFLRIDKTIISGTILGINIGMNQLILLCLIILLSLQFIFKKLGIIKQGKY